MAGWIIHVVGETIDDDLAPAISKFVKELQTLSHKVKEVRLTTDTGEKIIHVAQDVGDVVDAVDPGAEPAVTDVETEVDKEVTSHEDPPATSATPEVDTAPSTAPEASVPTNPPAAGASSIASNPPSGTPTAIPTT